MKGRVATHSWGQEPFPNIPLMQRVVACKMPAVGVMTERPKTNSQYIVFERFISCVNLFCEIIDLESSTL